MIKDYFVNSIGKSFSMEGNKYTFRIEPLYINVENYTGSSKEYSMTMEVCAMSKKFLRKSKLVASREVTVPLQTHDTRSQVLLRAVDKLLEVMTSEDN